MDNNIEEIKERIKRINEIHLEEEAFLVRELGGFGTGSDFELGRLLPNIEAETEKEYKEMNLDFTINILWEDAGICYINRRFRTCTILLACLVEALICLELTKREISYNTKMTLGQLINYCKGKKILTSVIEDIEEINKLRIEAVHLKSEKEKPEEVGKWDELVPVGKFKHPPVKIGSMLSENDATVCIQSGKCYVVYKYKKMAMKAYYHTQNILATLYGLKFNFHFNFL